MSTHHHVPADDEATAFSELVADCGCVEHECECHGLSLHPAPHPFEHHPTDVVISDATSHLVDGISDYGD